MNSMKLLVLTTAFDDKQCGLLHESCDYFGADLVVLNKRRSLASFRGNWTEMKFGGILSYLSEHKEHEVVMYLDAKDTILNRPANEIVQRYGSNMGSMVLVSTELNCFPVPEFRHLFERRAKDLDARSSFIYPNAGGFIGWREKVVNLLRKAISYGEVSDQLALQLATLFDGGVALDYHSFIFHSMFANRPEQVVLDACALHFNGGEPGIEDAWEAAKVRWASLEVDQ